MSTEVGTKSYAELMFGRFNTPAALDDLMYLLDWDEMYSAVELPAAAILVPQGPPDNNLGMFGHALYAIFGAKRNTSGWRVRGMFYCACADGFEGCLSLDCTALTAERGSAPLKVRFFDEYRESYGEVYGRVPTQENLNGLFSGIYGPCESTYMVGDAKRAVRSIVGGKDLRGAIIGDATSEIGYRDLDRQAAILKHIRGWYRAFCRNQAICQHRLAHGDRTQELASVPSIRAAVALANRELGKEKARISRSYRSL